MKKLLTILLLTLLTTFYAFAQNGIIREFSGEVELKPAGSASFVPAQPGDSVAQDTIVSTGFKSTAIIVIGSSTIAVRPLTRLSLSEIQSSSGTENLNVNLQAGRIKVDVKPPAGTRANCTVQSPSATASVRGTSFEFDTRNLTVSEGTVVFHGNNGMPMLVPAGESSQLDSEGKAADPLVVSAESLTPPPPVGTSSDASAAVPAPAPPTEGDIAITVSW